MTPYLKSVVDYCRLVPSGMRHATDIFFELTAGRTPSVVRYPTRLLVEREIRLLDDIGRLFGPQTRRAVAHVLVGDDDDYYYRHDLGVTLVPSCVVARIINYAREEHAIDLPYKKAPEALVRH